jgi:glycosyltransferase involved in cell wall biosynthesis
MKRDADLSITTPCFIEKKNIENCVCAVHSITEKELSELEYEHLFIDNCCTDSTVDSTGQAAKGDARVNLIDERKVTSSGVLDSFSKDWPVNGTQ